MTKQKGTGVSQIVQLIVYYILGSCTFILCRISWVYYQFLQCKYECRLGFLHQFFYRKRRQRIQRQRRRKGRKEKRGRERRERRKRRARTSSGWNRRRKRRGRRKRTGRSSAGQKRERKRKGRRK